MKLYKFLFFVCIVFLFSSCAFSGTFHRSEKISVDLDKITHFNSGTDTTYINYNKAKEEITLSKSDNKIINDSYTIQNHYFLSSCENQLNGWMLKPKNKKPIATVLHFHGSAQNLFFQYKAIEPLVELGFQVFTFDYSGYGFSEGKSTRKNVLKDAYSALDFVNNKEDIQNSKLIIYGQSYGGYLASIVGSNRQQKIDGIVIEGAFSSHKEEAKHMSPFFGNLVKEEITAEDEIQKNYKPVLIIHSTEDEMVPFKFGKKIYENANMPKEFYEINKTHINGLQYYSEEISEKINKILMIE
jgi:alpha/beta superfamily hydrolase